jgi:hypothetical protein
MTRSVPSGCGNTDIGPELLNVTVFPFALSWEMMPCGWISIRMRSPSASNTRVWVPEPLMSWYVTGNGQKPSMTVGSVVRVSGERTFVRALAGAAANSSVAADRETTSTIERRIILFLLSAIPRGRGT